MRKFLRQAGYLLLIIILLPYVITVFINGNGLNTGMGSNSPYVTVKRDNKTKQMPLAEYAIGVLAKEIDADMEKEAIKAQAVLIRTSIYKTIQEEGSSTTLTKGYWTRSQMEDNWGTGEYAKKYEKMKKAWEETEGQVLMYNGSLALTPYHKLSNGKTRAGSEVFGVEDYPYLMVKDCPQDVEAPEAMTTSMIQGTDMEVTKTDSAGYVTEVRCGQETVSGEEFRDTYHLASASFTLQPFENQIRVTSAGIGHGLGMSQYTAEKMAEEGKTCAEILTFFFEGTALEEVAEIVTM
ncbi:SpoIID/LytB domain-containing protein [Bariatricus massiliensis]|uniref:SpoIID/LytB domain-containing protein n=1 Tax=Bariatricus massiliensis TaxID=1745713 RepID=UPI00083026B5|nr:SpoIID/LytB domain-containing protein [Bariatricus massiliensis]MDY2662674.1 SpoIID/LytB domain-containing protein [Bariatricus massiliensis]